MIVIMMVSVALIGTLPYTLASWAAADGLPLFTDWGYWAGLVLVMCLGAGAGWLLWLMAQNA